MHTHTHTHLTAHGSSLPGWASTRKVRPIWILLKQETVSGSGISWAICKPVPHSRQITTPAPHHSVFYRLDALLATQPTASKHWRHIINICNDNDETNSSLCAGDALGIYAENCGDDVSEILSLAGWDGSRLVDVPAHAYQPVTGLWLIAYSLLWGALSKAAICPSVCLSHAQAEKDKKVKVTHTRLPSVGLWSWSRFSAVSLQVMWVINPVVGCHYFPPGLQLPTQPLRGLLPVSLLGEQRHIGCEQFA